MVVLDVVPKDHAHLPLYYLIGYFFHEIRDGVRFERGLVWSEVDGCLDFSDRPFSPTSWGTQNFPSHRAVPPPRV